MSMPIVLIRAISSKTSHLLPALSQHKYFPLLSPCRLPSGNQDSCSQEAEPMRKISRSTLSKIQVLPFWKNCPHFLIQVSSLSHDTVPSGGSSLLLLSHVSSMWLQPIMPSDLPFSLPLAVHPTPSSFLLCCLGTALPLADPVGPGMRWCSLTALTCLPKVISSWSHTSHLQGQKCTTSSAQPLSALMHGGHITRCRARATTGGAGSGVARAARELCLH